MTETPKSLVEQDPTVGRVAETALRMMAGAVGPRTMRDVQDLLRRSPDTYPWQEVCDLVMAESVDPGALVNKAIVAQRDWLQRGGRTASGPARPKKLLSNSAKRFVARIVVRGGFYLVFALIFVVILVLLRTRWPEFDIYRVGDSIAGFVKGLLG